MFEITFQQFSKINRDRCVNELQHSLEDWSPAEWSNAMAGECGEACNLTKKLLRGDDVSIEEVGKELADVVCYADLVASRLGLDLGDCVVEKFNEVSDRRGCRTKIDISILRPEPDRYVYDEVEGQVMDKFGSRYCLADLEEVVSTINRQNEAARQLWRSYEKLHSECGALMSENARLKKERDEKQS